LADLGHMVWPLDTAVPDYGVLSFRLMALHTNDQSPHFPAKCHWCCLLLTHIQS